jgi:hypothetical protein
LIADGLADGEFGEEHDAVGVIARRARDCRGDQAAAEQSQTFLHNRLFMAGAPAGRHFSGVLKCLSKNSIVA